MRNRFLFPNMGKRKMLHVGTHSEDKLVAISVDVVLSAVTTLNLFFVCWYQTEGHLILGSPEEEICCVLLVKAQGWFLETLFCSWLCRLPVLALLLHMITSNPLLDGGLSANFIFNFTKLQYKFLIILEGVNKMFLFLGVLAVVVQKD